MPGPRPRAREQAAVEPLPHAIAPIAMKRIAASVGRCDLCRLERAAWSGQGVHLCETCFQRESRRAVEAGGEVTAVRAGMTAPGA